MREIRSQDWNTFCERLNEFERGAIVDIHWIDRATKTEKEIARAAQFQEITFGKRDGCNDQIVVRAGGKAQTRHEIVEPIHILLREMGEDGAFNAIAVEAEEGTTLLRFNPVIRPSWLEGISI
jgi:Family of unknown function (DUF5335)